MGVNFPEIVEIKASIWWVPLGYPVHLTEQSLLNHSATQYHNMSTFWMVSVFESCVSILLSPSIECSSPWLGLMRCFSMSHLSRKIKTENIPFFLKLTSSQVQLKSVSVECWWFCPAVGEESIWHEGSSNTLSMSVQIAVKILRLYGYFDQAMRPAERQSSPL